MIAAMAPTGKLLAINWPLAWVESHVTAKRLIDEGVIGALTEVHFYDGNRGPLYHLADKVEVTREEVEAQKPSSWWYKRASGGGSLLDYLGYGATLGTWYFNGKAPIEVTCAVDETPGIEVDQHSIAICRYDTGLSKMETRWGTFTDPWVIQPQPHCGFVFVGADGTIQSRDYADHVAVQTRARPEPTPVARRSSCRRAGATPSNMCLAASREAMPSPARSIRRCASPRSASLTPPRSRRARSARWRWCHERRNSRH